MKIGILRSDDVRESLVGEFGEYPEMFDRLLRSADSTVETLAYDVQRGEYPDDIDEVDAYLITGSKASVYDDTEWIGRLTEFVGTLNEGKKKLIGVCFGHQLVAHALGGRTEKSSKGWGVGVHRHRLNDEGKRFTGETSGFDVIVSHQDQVVVPARGTTVLAGSEFCPVAMCRVGDHILTIQGHPEFGVDYARRLFALRRDQLGEALVREGTESLETKVDSTQIAKWMIRFIR